MGFKLFLKRLALAGMLAAILWTSWQVAQATYQKWRLKAQVQELKAKAQNLENKNQQLKELIAAFQDPSFLKLQAKQQFNLKEPGEQVIVVLPPDKQSNNQPSPAPTLAARVLSIFQKGHLPDWWKFFFE